MNKIFRKAITVLGSVALVGASIGAAAAAAYPEPFTSNTAIVVGANAAPSDSIAASSIAANVDAASTASMSSGTKTVSGGESYKFEKSATAFNLGDTFTTIRTTLDDDYLPTLLAEGVYLDDNNNEKDYTQKITMVATQLTMFEDSDYKDDVPTVGFVYGSGDNVLTYTLTFTDTPTVSDMNTTDLVLMGKNYYVLEAIPTVFTLLDAASDTIVAEGESVTLTAGGKTYDTSIEFVDSTSTKLKINGEVTNKLAEGETFKLSDGSYVGVKEVLYAAKDTGISKVEFSVGSGKLVLTSGSEVELNDDNVEGLTATISTSSGALTSIALDWDTDDDYFVTEDSELTMPGFGAVKLSFGGLDYPAEEEISVEHGSDTYMVLNNFPLKDSNEDIPLLYGNGTHFSGLGSESGKGLLTDANADGNITFDDDLHEYFVASYDDGRETESYLMQATGFKIDSGVNKTTFQYKKDGAWVDAKTDAQDGDTVSVGNVELDVGVIDKAGENVVITNGNANTNFNKLYSKEGLQVLLPLDGNNASVSPSINFTSGMGFNPDTYVLQMFEEDEDGDTAGAGIGGQINATFAWTTDSRVQVSSVAGGNATAREIGSTNVFRNFKYSALATEILHDQDGDQDTLKLVYHGDEVKADVYITSSDATLAGSGEAGVMTVLDSAVSTVAGKNLIVVGGSAINSVAAELLGGAYREAEFTSMTGVGAGEFLIQSFDRSGKTALLVAGYNAADTTKAATYLVNADSVNTATGTKYKGTSATEASLVVA
jgi:hypothetical protein